MRDGSRLRWWIAYRIGRSRRQCWSELVWWALDGPRGCRRRGDSPWPWRPVASSVCGMYAGRCACPCGNVPGPDGVAGVPDEAEEAQQ